MDRAALPHLANASRVTPQLLVGGGLSPDPALAAVQLDELVALGVRLVLDARLEWSDEDLVRERAPHVRYLHVGMDDAGQRVPAAWFDHAAGTAAAAVRRGEVVLAHCHMGINRGPSLGLAVLLALEWDLVDALDAIRTARPIAAMAYAEDALRWHHGRTPGSGTALAEDGRRLAAWRAGNPLDVVRLIRQHEERGA